MGKQAPESQSSELGAFLREGLVGLVAQLVTHPLGQSTKSSKGKPTPESLPAGLLTCVTDEVGAGRAGPYPSDDKRGRHMPNLARRGREAHGPSLFGGKERPESTGNSKTGNFCSPRTHREKAPPLGLFFHTFTTLRMSTTQANRSWELATKAVSSQRV